jgi:two-component system response regulator HydG
LPSPLQQALTQAAPEEAVGDKIVPMELVEKQAILTAIEQLDGDKLLAARLLNIGKTTLYRKLKEYASQD